VRLNHCRTRSIAAHTAGEPATTISTACGSITLKKRRKINNASGISIDLDWATPIRRGWRTKLGALGLVLNCITLWDTVYLDATA
jgi:hypothetical protein